MQIRGQEAQTLNECQVRNPVTCTSALGAIIKNIMYTFKTKFTLSEVETIERALLTYQNYIQKQYADTDEIRMPEQQNISKICHKLNGADFTEDN